MPYIEKELGQTEHFHHNSHSVQINLCFFFIVRVDDLAGYFSSRLES